MSYVLSALKKAARERELGRIPDISSTTLTDDIPREKSGHYGAIGFSAGIGILVVINVVLFMSLDDTNNADNINDTRGAGVALPRPEASPVPRASVKAPLKERVRSGKRTPDMPVVTREPVRLIEVPNETVPEMEGDRRPIIPAPPQAGQVVDYADLSADTREMLPQLDISGHVYVPGKPEHSRVIINGRSLRTGSAVGQGVRIDGITDKEVVFSLDDWQFRIQTDSLF